MATRQRVQTPRKTTSIPTSFDPASFDEASSTQSTVADAAKPKFVGESLIYKERYERIAEAAYHRAEQRGFAPGNELDDWLAAEHEVDALLSANRDRPAQ